MEAGKFTLAALRVNAGYTQAKLAKLLGVTQGAVSLWEKGIASPRINTAKKLANLYGTTLDGIYFAKPQENKS